MTILEFSQTLFFITASVATIVIGTALGIVVYNLIHITKELRRTAENLKTASADFHAHLENIMEKISNLPIITTLIKLITPKRKKKVSEE